MADYNLTQTGEEVQELLNKISLIGKFTCSDAADSQVKNIYIDDFTLIDSVAIAVTFVNGNSAASIQLNVNYTGNVPVYYRNSPLGAGLFTANATVILMYNATGNRWDVLSELCGTIGEAASRDVATEITDESSDEDIPTVGAVKGTMKGLPEQYCSFVFRKTAGGELTVPSGLAQLAAMRGKSVISNEKILNFNAESLKTVGFNQWDEEWNIWGGNLAICTVNKIKVIGGQKYYFYCGSSYFVYWLFDSNGYIIGTTKKTPTEANISGTIDRKKELLIPLNVTHIMFALFRSYGTTYKHDICINISDPSKNGTYEPYWESNLPLNINTQTGKLNGSGNSVVVFPDGMAGMNGVQDTIIGNTAVKKFLQVNDLTTLPITLNYEGYAPEEEGGDTVYSFILELPKNAKAFTASVMNGLFNKKYSAASGISAASSNNFYIYNLQGKSYVEIMDDDFSTDARFADEEQWDALIADIRTSLADKVMMYELLSYEQYTLDNMAMPLSYKIDKNGTEQIIPSATDPDNTVPSTVPCDITAKYKLSHVEEVWALFDLCHNG